MKRCTGSLSHVQIARRRNGESRSEEPERGAGNELTFPFSIQEDIEEKVCTSFKALCVCEDSS